MAKKKLDIGELGKEWEGVLNDVVDEGDPAAALIGAAYVDESLGAMFHKLFVRGKTSDALLDPAGALGNYNARVKLAYSMGFITKDQRNDLDVIAQIRNRFAHTFEKCSFHDPEIIELCCKLKGTSYDSLVRLGAAIPGKVCYAMAALRLAHHLQCCGNVTRHAETADPFEVNRESWKRIQKGRAMFLKYEP